MTLLDPHPPCSPRTSRLAGASADPGRDGGANKLVWQSSWEISPSSVRDLGRLAVLRSLRGHYRMTASLPGGWQVIAAKLGRKTSKWGWVDINHPKKQLGEHPNKDWLGFDLQPHRFCRIHDFVSFFYGEQWKFGPSTSHQPLQIPLSDCVCLCLSVSLSLDHVRRMVLTRSWFDIYD